MQSTLGKIDSWTLYTRVRFFAIVEFLVISWEGLRLYYSILSMDHSTCRRGKAFG